MPDAPPMEVAGLRERWEGTPENRTLLSALQQEVDGVHYGEINVGSRVALDRRAADVAGMRETKAKVEWEKIRWQDVQGDIKQGRYWQAARTMFGWIFGGRRAVEGLGLYTNSVDSLPLDVRRGIVTQLHQHLEDGPRTFDDELKRSAVRFETELSLARRGYVQERVATRSRHVVIGPGQTLATHVPPPVMGRLRAAGGADPEILGPLTFDRPLPVGAFLYLDRDGFPLLVSRELIPPGRFPPVPIFRRTPGAGVESASNREAKINFLQNNIQPGDILLVSKNDQQQNLFHRMFQGAAQYLTAGRDRAFHGSHVMTVGQDKTVHHINFQGRHSATLRQTIERHGYAAITVARTPNPEKAQALAKQMETVAARERTFNQAGLVREGIASFRQRMGAALGGGLERDTTSTDTSCICVDYATDAAEGLLPQLAACRTPADIARCQDVRLVYSVELPQT